MKDYYRTSTAVAVQPCPQCSSTVFFGELLNAPPESQEFDYRGMFLACGTCGWDVEERLDDTSSCMPGEFFDVLWHLVGWSLDGRYVNCCEGPVMEGGWGNHLHTTEPTA